MAYQSSSNSGDSYSIDNGRSCSGSCLSSSSTTGTVVPYLSGGLGGGGGIGWAHWRTTAFGNEGSNEV